jgi:Histidine kinase-, DNA gyrase B-, and HSP90-like ATPase
MATAQKDGGVTIAIADTGIGMTHQEIVVAMKPFVQVQDHLARSQEGTGLGLPLALGLARLQSSPRQPARRRHHRHRNPAAHRVRGVSSRCNRKNRMTLHIERPVAKPPPHPSVNAAACRPRPRFALPMSYRSAAAMPWR